MKFRTAVLTDFAKLVKELGVVLKDLSFEDNFTSFLVENQTLPANTETKIRNQLKVRPSKYIIVFQTGNALITAGDTAWDDNFLYMKNHHATNSAVVSIIFIK